MVGIDIPHRFCKGELALGTTGHYHTLYKTNHGYHVISLVPPKDSSTSIALQCASISLHVFRLPCSTVRHLNGPLGTLHGMNYSSWLQQGQHLKRANTNTVETSAYRPSLAGWRPLLLSWNPSLLGFEDP